MRKRQGYRRSTAGVFAAVIAVTMTTAGVAQAAVSGQVLGAYDPITGDVTLDVGTGNNNVALGIFGGPLDFELADFDDSTALGALLGTAGVDNLDIYFNLTTEAPAGVYNIGDVLAAGLSQGDLDGLVFAVGGSGSTFSQVTVIPEPASLALLGLGGVALVMRRRSVS